MTLALVSLVSLLLIRSSCSVVGRSPHQVLPVVFELRFLIIHVASVSRQSGSVLMQEKHVTYRRSFGSESSSSWSSLRLLRVSVSCMIPKSTSCTDRGGLLRNPLRIGFLYKCYCRVCGSSFSSCVLCTGRGGLLLTPARTDICGRCSVCLS